MIKKNIYLCLKRFYKDCPSIIVKETEDTVLVKTSHRIKNNLGNAIIYSIQYEDGRVILNSHLPFVRPYLFNSIQLKQYRGEIVGVFVIEDTSDLVSVVTDLTFGIFKILNIREPVYMGSLSELKSITTLS